MVGNKLDLRIAADTEAPGENQGAACRTPAYQPDNSKYGVENTAELDEEIKRLERRRDLLLSQLKTP